MDIASREELIGILNEMLEAERAGARVCLRTAQESSNPEIQSLARYIHREEAKWCDMLTGVLNGLGTKPSLATGDFYGKAMAVAEEYARLALLNRGQRWVVRKLDAVLPRISDERLYEQLLEMKDAHEDNIDMVNAAL